MRFVQARSLTAILFLALAACGEDGSPRESDQGESSAPDDDGDESADDDVLSPRGDAGQTRKDAGQPQKDAGKPTDDPPFDAGKKPPAVVDAGVPVVDAGSATSGDAGPVASGNDVPMGDHCAPVAAWDAKSAQYEEEVLKLTNEARAVGHNCDTKGTFGPTTPLKMQPQLRCSSRLHSKYMGETGEFDHIQTATMLDPFDRMMAAGYKFTRAGENIAAGQQTPKQVVDGWLDSDGHCANIMEPRFQDIGIGYYVQAATGTRAKPYWTQNFGSSGR